MPNTYLPPAHPYPWPQDLACGAAHINWPSKDIFSSRTLNTQVAIPETWVDVGVDIDGEAERGNKTKGAFSLVLTRERAIGRRGGDGVVVIRYVPAYRNKIFATSNDEFFDPDKYYLEYLGEPDTARKCDIPYHLLSYQYLPSLLENWKLASSEGTDWLFQLYAGGLKTEDNYEMPMCEGGKAIEALAESEELNLCDPMGKHWRNGKCVLEKSEVRLPERCPVAVESPAPRTGDRGLLLGLAIGMPLGLVILILLGYVVLRYVPAMRNVFRRMGDGAIRL